MRNFDDTDHGVSFLAALADLLIEEVGVLERVSDHVSDLMSAQGCSAHELVVSMQGFDRVKQEFAAIGNVLRLCSRAPAGGLSAQAQNSIVADITVAALRDRLLALLAAGPERNLRAEDIWQGHADGEEAVF
jgi:hypothetical protein